MTRYPSLVSRPALRSLYLFTLALKTGVFLATLSAVPAFAITYYVDPVGGNDARDGQSPATAWRTVARVVSQDTATRFSAGDSLLFKRGTKVSGRLTLSGSGTAAIPLFLGAYGSGARPILDATGQQGATLELRGSYVTVQGLALTGSLQPAGLYASGRGSHLTVDDLEVYGNARHGILLESYDDVSITHVDVHHNATDPLDAWAGIMLVSDGRITIKNITIASSVIHDNWGPKDTMDEAKNGIAVGIPYHTPYPSIENLRITENRIFNNGNKKYTRYGRGVNARFCGTVTVDRNEIYANASTGVFFTSGDCGSVTALVRANVLADNPKRQLGGLLKAGSSISVLHNLLLHRYGAGSSGKGIEVGTGGGVWRVHNNIFSIDTADSGSDGTFIIPENDFTLYSERNLFASGVSLRFRRVFADGSNAVLSLNSWRAAGWDLQTQSADPLFVGYNPATSDFLSQDFHLAALSKAIDAGSVVPSGVDLDGLPVPVGAGPDIGPYEYQSAASNQPPSVQLGADIHLTAPGLITLKPQVSDDGLPTPFVSYRWETIAGGSGVTFSNEDAKETIANFSTAGTFTVRLTVFDGERSGSDDLTVVVDRVQASGELSYYVDSLAGNDAADGRSPSTAWRSVARVEQSDNGGIFRPGDKLLFRRGGRWTEPLRVSTPGDATRPFTVSWYGVGATPIFDLSSTPASVPITVDTPWVTIEGIRCTGSSATGALQISPGAHHVVLQNLEIIGNGKNGVTIRNASDVKLLTSQILSNGSDSSASWAGILLQADGGVTVSNVLIAGNDIGLNQGNAAAKSNAASGIVLGSGGAPVFSQLAIVGNRIRQNGLPGQTANGHGIAGKFCGSVLVADNRIYQNASSGVLLSQAKSCGVLDVKSIQNIYYDNPKRQLAITTAAPSTVAMYHNLFVHRLSAGSSGKGIETAGSTGRWTVRNNIFAVDSPASDFDGAILLSRATLFDSDYNLFVSKSKMRMEAPDGTFAPHTVSQWRSGGYDAHSVQADPLFRAYLPLQQPFDAQDLHLLPTSPARNAGTDVGLVTDLDGLPMPVGGTPDIGPFEIQ